MALKIMKRIPVFMMSIKYARSSSGDTKSGAGQSWSGIRFLHNLVNALPRQVVRIRNLAESHSLAAHAKNFRISVVIRRRTRLQWAPLPAIQIFKNLNLVWREKVLLPTLPDVADPRADVYFCPINNFNVNSRDPRVAGAVGELLQCSDIKLESGFVVHGWGLYNNFVIRARMPQIN